MVKALAMIGLLAQARIVSRATAGLAGTADWVRIHEHSNSKKITTISGIVLVSIMVSLETGPTFFQDRPVSAIRRSTDTWKHPKNWRGLIQTRLLNVDVCLPHLIHVHIFQYKLGSSAGQSNAVTPEVLAAERDADPAHVLQRLVEGLRVAL